MLPFTAENYDEAVKALGAKAFEVFADNINEETGEFLVPEATIELDLGGGSILVVTLTIDAKASDAV